MEPLVVDGNIITAVGMGYKEFAIDVGHKLNFDCNEGWFSGIKKPSRLDDYTFLEMHSDFRISNLESYHK